MPGRMNRTAFGQFDPLVKQARLRGSSGGGGGPVTAVTASSPLVSSGGPTPNIAPAPGQSLVQTAATAAALAAAPIPSTGQSLALVQSYGAYFTLQAAAVSPLIPDVVLASSDPGFRWSRVVTAIAPAALAQTTWQVDRLAGSNENTGQVGSPLRTKSEIARRWGTLEPVLDTTQVVVTVLSPDVDGSDPWLASPIFLNGASLRITAPLPAPTFTGTLLVVTPKNIPANQALASTFTPTLGAVAQDMLLVNTTRANSRAIAARDLGGGNFLITQPLAPYPGLPNPPTPTEVDTWAPGDAIVGYVPMQVDIGSIGGEVIEFNASFGPSFVVDTLTIFDPDGTGALSPLFCDAASNYLCSDVVCFRAKTGSGKQSANANIWQNCSVLLFFCESNQTGPGTVLAGGLSRQGGIFQGVQPSSGFMFMGSAVLRNSELSNYIGLLPEMYVDTPAQLGLSGNVTLGPGAIYGPGSIDVQGLFIYGAPATSTIPVAGKTLVGQPSAYSSLTTAGLVAVHRVTPITSATLDAPAGSAGFNGLAYMGAAAYSANGVQP